MADPNAGAGPREEPRLPPRGEPAFNLPAVIAVLIGSYLAVQIAMSTLGIETQKSLLLLFALFPGRYTLVDGSMVIFPGGLWGDLWSPITYTFLHGGWAHVIANSVWLLAFGPPVARRLGTFRFLFFYFLCGAIGAVVHILCHPGSLVPVVGASAAISGLMGGAARFVFLEDGPLGALGGGPVRRPDAPAAKASILGALTDRRTLIFIVIWIGLNTLFGAAGLVPGGGIVDVAWQAHLGGFVAGLLLFGLFDPPAYSPSGGPGNVAYGDWSGRDRR